MIRAGPSTTTCFIGSGAEPGSTNDAVKTARGGGVAVGVGLAVGVGVGVVGVEVAVGVGVAVAVGVAAAAITTPRVLLLPDCVKLNIRK